MDLDIQSYSLGHLGIVAGIFDTLKIGEVIDGFMPKQGSKNLPHSTIIKAMILNGVNGGVKLSTYGGIKLTTYLKSLLPA